MAKKYWIVSMIIVLALIFTSCTRKPNQNDELPPDNNVNEEDLEDNDMDEDNEDDQEENNGTEENSNNEGEQNNNLSFDDIKIKAEEAFGIFKEKHPNVKVSEIELERDMDSYHYQVEAYDNNKKYQVKINPVNGEITSEDSDKKEDVKGEITEEDIKKVGTLLDKAREDAGKDFKLDEWKLDFSDDKLILEIELEDSDKKELEYKYNLRTGELIKKE